MSESQRAILGFSIIICAFVAFFAWLADFGYPPLVWAARILAPVAFVWIIVALILDLREKDGAPDFIRQQALSPFERDGFCFAIVPKAVDNRLVMYVLFQNCHEQQSSARLVGKPALGFWLQDVPLTPFTIELACPPSGFGIAQVPVAVPPEYQGKEIKYEIGVDVRYPYGRGRRLLHKTGIHVGKPVFTTRFRAIFSIVGVFGGFHMLNPASFTFIAPQGVDEQFAHDPTPHVEYIWKLGDKTPSNPSQFTPLGSP